MIDRRAEIEARWEAIDHELEELWSGKVCDGDPATREAELLREQDALDYELGQLWFSERDGDVS